MSQDFTANSSSKAGRHGLAHAVAKAYTERGIRVHTAVPGYSETALVSAISGPQEWAATVSRISRGRPGTPADVEGIMVDLVSDESTYARGRSSASTVG